MSRRHLLKSVAASLLTGLVGCDNHKAPKAQPAYWSPAVKKLDDFLRKHKEKHVVAYWVHNSLDMIELYQSADFWEMLQSNNFTDYFYEFPEKYQPDIDRARQGVPGSDIDGYRRVMFHRAQEKGIATTAVDRGVREEESHYDYNEQIGELWEDYKQRARLDYADEDAAKEVDDKAALIRQHFKKTSEWEVAESYKKTMLRRFNDKATGDFSASLGQKARGRVWQSQGSGHFTDCGLHSYIQDVVVLELFVNKADRAEQEAEARNSDVFIDNIDHTAPVDHYAFLLDEAQIDFVPALKSPSEIRAAQAACLDQVNHPEKVIEDDYRARRAAAVSQARAKAGQPHRN